MAIPLQPIDEPIPSASPFAEPKEGLPKDVLKVAEGILSEQKVPLRGAALPGKLLERPIGEDRAAEAVVSAAKRALADREEKNGAKLPEARVTELPLTPDTARTAMVEHLLQQIEEEEIQEAIPRILRASETAFRDLYVSTSLGPQKTRKWIYGVKVCQTEEGVLVLHVSQGDRLATGAVKGIKPILQIPIRGDPRTLVRWASNRKYERERFEQDTERELQMRKILGPVPGVSSIHVLQYVDQMGVLKKRMVMQRYDGTLAQYLKAHKPISREAAQRILPMGFQVLQGLETVHQKNIVHLDIKFDNILTLGSTCVINDFGAARFIGEKLPKLVGTVYFMDPTLLDQDYRVNPKSDLFSFGVILLELCYSALYLGYLRKVEEKGLSRSDGTPCVRQVYIDDINRVRTILQGQSQMADLIRGLMDPDPEQRIDVAFALAQYPDAQEEFLRRYDDIQRRMQEKMQQAV